MTNEDLVARRIGRRVRSLRLQAEMSQEALALEIHVQQQTVSEIGRGTREIKPSELGRIARALGVSTDAINGGPGYTGEPIILRGAGNAGVGKDNEHKKRRKRG